MNTESKSADVSRPVLCATLALIAVASTLNASVTSFHPAIAMFKLLVGLLHLIAIGFATSSLLGLRRPGTLAVAQDALLGQVVCLAYVYLRSTLCNLLGIPGISLVEVFVAEAVFLGLVLMRRGTSIDLSATFRSRPLFQSGVCLLWLGWLLVVAGLKLDLYYTPSSDPDIHAYYARAFLERGHIYYDLLPGSDAWMVYPSGFGALNFVFGTLSGLHPVQLVNIAAYLQFALFAGASYSVLASAVEQRPARLIVALLHFGCLYFGYNAVFGEGRSFLEGTPRLAHTALLFFPLLFAAEHRHELGERTWLWMIPSAAAAVGICINPAHAPASVLIGTIALAGFGWHRDARTTASRHWSTIAASALVTTGLILSQDPFYRSLISQQTGFESVEAATDLTGGALSGNFDLGSLFTEAVPAALAALFESRGEGTSGTSATRVALVISLLAAMSVAVARRSRRSEQGADPIVLLGMCSLTAVVVHGVWSEFAPGIVEGGVLQTRLILRYTDALQLQLTALLLGIAPVLTVCIAARTFANSEETKSRFEVAALSGFLLLAAPLLYVQFQHDREVAYAAMRTTPLGEVAAADVEFARRLSEHVPRGERVLLPGRARRAPGEHWIFTTDAGRAVALFSTVRTSFFLGLDGAAFTADAYNAHVKPPTFDPAWLRAHQTTWLVESGNFPSRILARHYVRVTGTDRAVLWRLRD